MDILYYRRMLADRVRLRAFRRAIHATVRPGDVVVEIGAGLGTYSFFAAQAGARRVYAIEADPDVCRMAECIAEQNGLADRITFLRGYSTDIELPERADVAIFEDYSSFFFSGGLPRLLRDIRERHLKRLGSLIPRGVDLFVAAAEDYRTYRQLNQLRGGRDRLFGLDFSETLWPAMNLPISTYAAHRHLLTPPLRCARINLRNGQGIDLRFSGASRVCRNGTLHGVLGWMDLDLASGVRLSCSPLRPRTVWGQEFFPFAESLRVHRGKPLMISMELIVPRGISRYIQRWTVSAGEEHREGNTFASAPFSGQPLNGKLGSARRKLGPRSQVLLTLLSQLQRETPYQKVAATLVKKHPRFFDSREDALAAIVRLVPSLSSLAGSL